MQIPENTLKTALVAGQVQYGLWLASQSPVIAEVAGVSGFDWCLLDAEHGPNTLTELLPQLQVLEATGTQAVIRIPAAEVWIVKQALDMGCQTVLVPMVDDAATAERMARAMRYPPDGNRGMGAVLARASRYGAVADYIHKANDQVCLLVQAESAAALKNIDEIAATPGVDGVIIGPADLSADMGYPGQLNHPKVEAAIDHMFARIKAAGKIAGIIDTDQSSFAEYIDKGVTFLGIGADTFILRGCLEKLLRDAKG